LSVWFRMWVRREREILVVYKREVSCSVEKIEIERAEEVIENEVRNEEDDFDYCDWYLVVKYGDNIISTTSSAASATM